MPFGVIFAAVVFTVLGLWMGLANFALRPGLGRIGGLLLMVLGVSLGLGLLARQSLARWIGIGTGALFSIVGFVNVVNRGFVLDQVLLLASAGALVLLVIPATGNPLRGVDPSEVERRGRKLGVVALVAFVGVVGTLGWAWIAEAAFTARHVVSGPAAADLEWVDFGTGLEQAQAEGKPIFVDFFAEWCGPCHLMDKRTFRDPRVVEKLEDFVVVRVDSEERESHNGYTGVDLAEEFRVMGFPTVVVLNSEGREIARRSGFLGPKMLLDWLDTSVASDDFVAM